MRIGVFSDIHGNAVAFDAALAELERQGVERYLCLGDAIQGGPQPTAVVERLRALGCPVVMGNADAWLLSGVESGAETFSEERRRELEAVREWSLAQLSPANRAFIAGFQPTVALDLGGKALLGFHGSPASYDDLLLPDTPQERLAALLSAAGADLYCGGHTHVQFVRRIGAGPAIHFNPGSVGRAYSHHQPAEAFRNDPWAEFAILAVDGERVALSFHRVPIDVPALIAAYAASGRPYAAEAAAQYGAA